MELKEIIICTCMLGAFLPPAIYMVVIFVRLAQNSKQLAIEEEIADGTTREWRFKEYDKGDGPV